MPSSYTIGRLARAAGVRVSTIRFYERRGLLPPPPRRGGGYRTAGYRIYGEGDLARLRFIQEAKELGFSLHEIQDLLVLRVGHDGHTCESVRDYARRKVEEIDERLSRLRGLKRILSGMVAACERGGPEGDCPILSALGPGGLSGTTESRTEVRKTHAKGA